MDKKAVNTGIYLGILSLFLMGTVYVINYKVWLEWWFGLSLSIFFIIFTVVNGKKYRNPDSFSYGRALRFAYITLIISGIFGTLFSMLLHTFDTDLSVQISEEVLSKTENLFYKLGLSDDVIDEKLEELAVDLENQYTPMGLIQNFLLESLTTTLILALVAAIFIRKKGSQMVQS